MIDSIRAWISGNSPDHRKETGRRQEALQLALTALLIEAANSDDRFDETERGVISRLLESDKSAALFVYGDHDEGVPPQRNPVA